MRKLRTLIRETAGFLLRLSGIAWAIRSVFSRNKVAILVYHRPAAETFKAHLRYLGKRYKLIPLDRLVDAIQNGDSSNIPPKALVVTLDDGHKRNHELLPIIKEFDIRPTLYVCSDSIGTNRHFWWSEVSYLAARSIKRIPTNCALEKLRCEAGYETTKEYPKRQALTESEILDMEPHVDLGSHTRFHPILPQCENGKCMDEIQNSKMALETYLSSPVKHFAYPNGDYGEREVEYVRACGYRSARTLDVGWNDANSDPFRLKAIGIEDDASINILCGQLTGMFPYLKYLWHGSFGGKRPRFL
ncbi:MAG: polysaccharide deacetylase family protein [Planctomycetota bacterium]|jgi:peptidoglycan/xylan/chitin deacetylase (PgdA/CDA1 family)